MRYISRDGFNKIIDAFQGKCSTLEVQQQINKFMYNENIHFRYVPLPKKTMAVVAKMKRTAANPEKCPNWAKSLPDGSQILWNRKTLNFYYISSDGYEQNVQFEEYMKFFPKVVMTEDIEWLLDNWYSFRFLDTMKMFMDCHNGKLDMYDRYLSF